MSTVEQQLRALRALEKATGQSGITIVDGESEGAHGMHVAKWVSNGQTVKFAFVLNDAFLDMAEGARAGVLKGK